MRQVGQRFLSERGLQGRCPTKRKEDEMSNENELVEGMMRGGSEEKNEGRRAKMAEKKEGKRMEAERNKGGAKA